MALPDKLWLRRGEIIDGIGINEEIFTKWVRAGLVTPKYFPGQARAFYERAEVVKVQPQAKASQIAECRSQIEKLKGKRK